MSTPYVSQTQYGKNEDFTVQAARGQIQGHRVVTFSGYNADIDTTWVPIWADGSISFPTVATVMKISSSSAADVNTSGTGAWTVLLSGLNAEYNEISEVIALNGQTAVNTVNLYLRINGFTVITAGTGLTAAGNIYAGNGVVTAGVPATVYDFIPVGWNARQTAVYTIPAGYTAYVSYSRLTFAQVSGTNAVWGRVTITNSNNIKTATVSAVANNGIIEFQPKYPIPVVEKTLIMAESMGAAVNNYASTVIQLILIKNPIA
jgi:hypothetical protein